MFTRSLAAVLFAMTTLPAADPASPFAADAKVEKLSGGFKFTEGAKPDKDGNVYFTDQPNDRIHLWSVDGKLTTFMEPAGRSNGLFIDSKGTLWACADEKNELWTIDVKTKETKVVVKDFGGKLLNGPNDVWVGADGSAYFTDPYYKRDYWKRGKEEQDTRGAYHLSPKGELKRIEGEFKQPNGITGALDGKTLYVSDIDDKKTYSYTIGEGGKPTDRKPFCDAGSDGMTVDAEGNVYLTSGPNVLVFNKEGKKVAALKVPEAPANVCFGGKDFKTLFITARTGFYSVPTTVKGR